MRPDTGFFFGLPLILLLAAGFVCPFLAVAMFGFMPPGTFSVFNLPTLDNYRLIFAESYYQPLLWSLGLALMATAILFCICWPLAFGMAKIFGRFAVFVTLAVATTLVVSENIRLFGWTLVLMKNGILHGILELIGIPYRSMLYNVPIIVFGMVYAYLPFMLFPLVLGVSMIDDNMRQAAADLGAGRWRIFKEIDIPLAMPGILIGGMLTFVLAAGALAESKILGGQKVITITDEIESAYTYGQNWPLGSALSSLFLIILSLFVFAVLRRVDLDGILGRGN